MPRLCAKCSQRQAPHGESRLELKTGLPSALLVAVAMLAATVSYVHAHRSGCHRWHSCPSDTGSYVCGDLGYCSGCPDNDYCLAGKPQRTSRDGGSPRNTLESDKSGVPPKDAWTCPTTSPIKGNFTTSSGERCIYHMPGGQFYGKTKPERCYETEEEARQDGCRRSRR